MKYHTAYTGSLLPLPCAAQKEKKQGISFFFSVLDMYVFAHFWCQKLFFFFLLCTAFRNKDKKKKGTLQKQTKKESTKRKKKKN